MKKFKLFYILIIIISVLMIITKGFEGNIVIQSYSMNMVDGFNGNILLSPINSIIFIFIIGLTILFTVNKENETKYKWLLLIIIIVILLLFFPVAIDSGSGGISGISYESNVGFLQLISYILF